MADPNREVYVMVGDGSYLMMASEIVTSIQEGYKLTILVLDNHGFSSIGGLSQSVGSGGFGTDYRFRDSESGQLDASRASCFAANAQSIGATPFEPSLSMIANALEEARKGSTTFIVVEVAQEASPR